MGTSNPKVSDRVRFHLRFGWWSLLAFLTLGVALEALHGFKVGFYLDIDNEVRRLTWTLAHAHGALLGLVHVALAATLHIAKPEGWGPILGSRAMPIASVRLPWPITLVLAVPSASAKRGPGVFGRPSASLTRSETP